MLTEALGELEQLIEGEKFKWTLNPL
jgi:hypothetical protein